MPLGQLLEIQAREKLGMAPEWEFFRIQCMPPGGTETIYYAITGAIAPAITRGPRKGQRNWARKIKSTVRMVPITPEQHERWLAEWSARTGNCPKCAGDGKLFVRWNVVEGTTFKPCPDCNGTGKNKPEPFRPDCLPVETAEGV